MNINIVPYSPKYLSSLMAFSEEVWTRPKTSDYYRWRYQDCPNHVGFLALDGDRCLGLIWAFKRLYHQGHQQKKVLEIFDWSTRPEFEGSGVGILVMKALMESPEPLVSVGGTEMAQKLYPRLQWKKVGEVQKYFLPLGGKRLGLYAKKRFGLPAGLVEVGFRIFGKLLVRPRAIPNPKHVSCQKISTFDKQLSPLYENKKGVFSLPDVDFLNWLIKGSGSMGDYIPLIFTSENKTVGWSFSRVYKTEFGCEARLIDIQAAPSHSSLLPWIVSKTVQTLSEQRPDVILTMTNTPDVAKAFKENGFLSHRPDPIHVWSKDQTKSTEPFYFQGNACDGALLPCPV